MKGKTLQQVVQEIKGEDVSIRGAKEFAVAEFGQIYAWIKADVVTNILKTKKG
ncbi:hypothetical protein D3C85_1126310 [compost metagenome]